MRASPSPAIVVAVLALVAVLAGTAIAGPDASTSALSKKKVKKIAKKQARKQVNKLVPGLADEQIDKRAPGLAVASADTADSAASAQNSARLGGLGASAFERSTRIQFGRAAGDSAAALRLFAWPQMGLDVRTDGDTDSRAQLTIRNTGSQGLHVGNPAEPDADTTVDPSDASDFGPSTSSGPTLQIAVTQEGAPGLTMWISCYNNAFGGGNNEIRCFGFRSQA